MTARPLRGGGGIASRAANLHVPEDREPPLVLERQGQRLAFLEFGLLREGLTIIGVLPSHETVKLRAQAADVLSQVIDIA